ncbi:MAG: hypothetical protein WBG62_01170 [Cyclobacteriaceae bacterium]
MPDKPTVYSHHIFLFAFRWQPKNPENALSERFKTLTESLTKGNWKHAPLANYGQSDSDESMRLYNELTYFYPFARSALYDLQGEENDVLCHYEYDLPGEETRKYTITSKIPVKGTKDFVEKTYLLDIKNINANFYSTGVGVLSFHLDNTDENQKAPEDILTINDKGRRLYPGFLFIDEKQSNNKPNNGNVPSSISLEGFGKQIREDFSGFSNFQNFSLRGLQRFNIPSFISKLFPDSFISEFKIQPVLDDRMFVVSWFANAEKVEEIQQDSSSANYAKSDFWYRYLFIDGPDGEDKGLSNDQFQEELLTASTYARWVGLGTLYGVSRYSFMALFNEPGFLTAHVETMYYKMAELSLMQRASAISFSNRIADFVHDQKGDKYLKDSLDQARRLALDYLQFFNKVYFKEITAQEQGIEMYAMLHRQLEVQQAVEGVRNEVSDLHHYIQLKEEKQRNQAINFIAVAGILLALPAFFFSYFSFMKDREIFSKEPTGISWWVLGILLLMMVLAYGAYHTFLKQTGWRRWVNGYTIPLLLLFFLLLIVPYFL